MLSLGGFVFSLKTRFFNGFVQYFSKTGSSSESHFSRDRRRDSSIKPLIGVCGVRVEALNNNRTGTLTSLQYSGTILLAGHSLGVLVRWVMTEYTRMKWVYQESQKRQVA